MLLSDEGLVKVLGAETTQAALKIAVGEALETHMFFDERILELEKFWDQLNKDVPVPDNMDEVFEAKEEYGRFQQFLDQYTEAAYKWYSNNFKAILAFLK